MASSETPSRAATAEVKAANGGGGQIYQPIRQQLSFAPQDYHRFAATSSAGAAPRNSDHLSDGIGVRSSVCVIQLLYLF